MVVFTDDIWVLSKLNFQTLIFCVCIVQELSPEHLFVFLFLFVFFHNFQLESFLNCFKFILSLFQEFLLRCDVVFDVWVQGRYLLSLVENSMENSLIEVLPSWVKCVFHFECFFIVIWTSFHQIHFINQISCSSLLLLGRLLECVKLKVSDTFRSWNLNHVEALMIFSDLRNKCAQLWGAIVSPHVSDNRIFIELDRCVRQCS